MVTQGPGVGQVVECLRRQRVCQGDLRPALEFVIAQPESAAKCGGAGWQIAWEIKRRALELHRAHSFVPKFVVEDLIEEAIRRLEQARRP